MYVFAPFAKTLTNLAKSVLIFKEVSLWELCPTGKSKGISIANTLLHIILVY